MKKLQHFRCMLRAVFLLLIAMSAYLVVAPSNAQQDKAAPATVSAPIVVPIRDLNLWRDFGALPEVKAGTVALSPNERRLYVGVRSSGRSDRRNLAVFTLDAAGKVVSQPRRYEVGDEPLVPGFDVLRCHKMARCCCRLSSPKKLRIQPKQWPLNWRST